MFSEKDYTKLNSIWDGCLTNGSKVCSNCGACCHNTDKTLFPNEYAYLENNTGQSNTGWRSLGCLCMTIDKGIKPVICKVFPMQVKVTLDGKISLDKNIGPSEYSNNCKKLTITDKDRSKVMKYLEFLFSDIHNRVFYILNFQLDEHIEEEKKYLKELKTSVSKISEYERGLYSALGLGVEENFEKFKY